MAVKQAEQLKISATNIKSILVSSNKTLQRINSKKSALVRKSEEKDKQASAEVKAEAKPTSGPIKGIFKNIGGMAVSFKDRILNFFGYLLLGFVINKLPAIFASISKSLKKVQEVWDGIVSFFKSIGDGMKKVSETFTSLIKPKDAEKDLKSVEEELNALDKEIDADNLLEDLPEAEDEGVDVEPDDADIEGMVQDTAVPPLPGGGDDTAPTTTQPPSGSVPKRNIGGEVEKNEQAQQQPTKSPQATKKTSPLRLFPDVVKSGSSSITEFSDNIDKLLSIGLGGGGGGTNALTEQAKVRTFGDTVKEVNRNWGFIGAEGTNYRTQKDYEGVYSVKDKIDDALLSLNNGISPVRKRSGNMQLSQDEEVQTITMIQPIEVEKLVPMAVSSGSNESLPQITVQPAQHIPIP